MAAARLTLRVDLGGDRAIGPGKIRLLEAIRDTGSITKAGAALGAQKAADVLRAAAALGNGRRACEGAAVPIEIVQPWPLLGSGLPGRRTGVGADPFLRN